MMKKSGFTTIEVLLAMFILISAVYVLSDLQMRSILRVLRDREKIDRVFLVKKELYQVLFDKKAHAKRTTTSLENPEIKIVTEPTSFEKKSDLEKADVKIQLLRTKGNWESSGRKNNITMISLIPTPQEKGKTA